MLKRCIAFVVLAICLALIVDSSGQSQRPAPRSRESVQPPISKTDNPAQPSAPDQRGTEQSPVIVKVLPSVDEKQKATAEAKREEQKAANDESLAKFTERLFWATVALSFIAMCQLFVFCWQGIQLKRTVDLSNREFIATHRPELIVREITWARMESGDDGQNGTTAIAFTLVNRGRNFCEIVESVFEYSTTSGNGQAVRTWGHNHLGRVAFERGQFRSFPYQMRSELEQLVVSNRNVGNLSHEHYFRGTVIYADRAGIQRRFAFTRRCPPGSDRFLRTGDPEDEYTD